MLFVRLVLLWSVLVVVDASPRGARSIERLRRTRHLMMKEEEEPNVVETPTTPTTEDKDEQGNNPPAPESPEDTTSGTTTLPPYCVAAIEGHVYATNDAMEVAYAYDLRDDSDLSHALGVGDYVNQVLTETLIQTLIVESPACQDRRRLSSRGLEPDAGIRGIEAKGTIVLDEEDCTSFAGENCIRLQSNLVYYLSDEANQNAAETVVMDEITKAFTSEPNNDVVLVRATGPSAQGGDTNNVHSPQQDESSGPKMKPEIIVFIVVGILVALVLAAFLVVRHRRNNNFRREIDKLSKTMDLSSGSENGDDLVNIYDSDDDNDTAFGITSTEHRLSRLTMSAVHPQTEPEVSEAIEVSSDGKIRANKLYSVKVVRTGEDAPMIYSVSDTVKL